MSFLEAAINLAFGSSGEVDDVITFKPLIFATASALYGVLVVFLDMLLIKLLNNKSLLKLSYSGYRAWFMFLLWGLGSGIGALLGSGVGIFEINRAACIFVGVGWPFVLPRLISSTSEELSTEKL